MPYIFNGNLGINGDFCCIKAVFEYNKKKTEYTIQNGGKQVKSNINIPYLASRPALRESTGLVTEDSTNV